MDVHLMGVNDSFYIVMSRPLIFPCRNGNIWIPYTSCHAVLFLSSCHICLFHWHSARLTLAARQDHCTKLTILLKLFHTHCLGLQYGKLLYTLSMKQETTFPVKSIRLYSNGLFFIFATRQSNQKLKANTQGGT